jgi:hypothetical protein
MIRRRDALMASAALLGPNAWTASAAQVNASASNDVKYLCTQPATAGKRWSIVTSGTGEIKLRQGNGTVRGSYKLTKDEWSGMQRVLEADQAGDNADYRDCVQKIMAALIRVSPRSQVEIDRKLKGFMASRNLAIPGRQYSDQDLLTRFSVRPMTNGVNFSYKILSGTFDGFLSETDSPLGHFSRIFARRNGVIVGVMITSYCSPNMTNVCKNDYDDWHSTLVDAEGAFKISRMEIAGGPAGSDAGKVGVLMESIAYDDHWRVLVNRVDMKGNAGPTSATLVIAFNEN